MGGGEGRGWWHPGQMSVGRPGVGGGEWVQPEGRTNQLTEKFATVSGQGGFPGKPLFAHHCSQAWTASLAGSFHYRQA